MIAGPIYWLVQSKVMQDENYELGKGFFIAVAG